MKSDEWSPMRSGEWSPVRERCKGENDREEGEDEVFTPEKSVVL